MLSNLLEVYRKADLKELEKQVDFLKKIALYDTHNISGSAAYLAIFLEELPSINPKLISVPTYREHRRRFVAVYMKGENANDYSEGIMNFLDCVTDALVQDTGDENFLLSEGE